MINKIKSLAPLSFILISLISAGYQILNQINKKEQFNPSTDMVMRWDARIQDLRQALPPNINQVGYLDTSMVTENIKPFDGEEYFLMQYSIAPIVLEYGIEEPWIIGNFDNDTDFILWLDEHIIEYEIQSFSFSLYLIHKLDD